VILGNRGLAKREGQIKVGWDMSRREEIAIFKKSFERPGLKKEEVGATAEANMWMVCYF
jgi:hypothetical protein